MPFRLQSKTSIGSTRLAYAHAIVSGDRSESAREALADSAEFPFGAVAIDFAEDHRGFGRSVFREVIAHDFGAGLVVDRTDEGVRDLAEALAALFTFVDRDGARHLVRPEARRVGKECVLTCRSRWSRYHSKNKSNHHVHVNSPHKK